MLPSTNKPTRLEAAHQFICFCFPIIFFSANSRMFFSSRCNLSGINYLSQLFLHPILPALCCYNWREPTKTFIQSLFLSGDTVSGLSNYFRGKCLRNQNRRSGTCDLILNDPRPRLENNSLIFYAVLNAVSRLIVCSPGLLHV